MLQLPLGVAEITFQMHNNDRKHVSWAPVLQVDTHKVRRVLHLCKALLVSVKGSRRIQKNFRRGSA